MQMCPECARQRPDTPSPETSNGEYGSFTAQSLGDRREQSARRSRAEEARSAQGRGGGSARSRNLLSRPPPRAAAAAAQSEAEAAARSRATAAQSQAAAARDDDARETTEEEGLEFLYTLGMTWKAEEYKKHLEEKARAAAEAQARKKAEDERAMKEARRRAKEAKKWTAAEMPYARSIGFGARSRSTRSGLPRRARRRRETEAPGREERQQAAELHSGAQ